MYVYVIDDSIVPAACSRLDGLRKVADWQEMEKTVEVERLIEIAREGDWLGGLS